MYVYMRVYIYVRACACVRVCVRASGCLYLCHPFPILSQMDFREIHIIPLEALPSRIFSFPTVDSNNIAGT
jgi:hypothetical protein